MRRAESVKGILGLLDSAGRCHGIDQISFDFRSRGHGAARPKVTLVWVVGACHGPTTKAGRRIGMW